MSSLRSAINDKCRECIYDPLSRGNWREQVATCAASTCGLHSVRPVPRSCMVAGQIDASTVAEIAAKLEP